ncbi:MAG: hypothetical protein WBB82_13405 [Limnothrix sp.]
MTLTIDQLNLQQERPSSETLLALLVRLEKEAKRERRVYPFESLLGEWRLTFITGTKKAQKQAGNVLGKGRYLPGWVKISILYEALSEQEQIAESAWQRGTVVNTVGLGLLKLAVSGGIKFQAQKRLLAFDFTQLNVRVAGAQFYNGSMRGGMAAAQKFYETPISELPFFSYFYVGETAIAARGKGGGIALWTKTSTKV